MLLPLLIGSLPGWLHWLQIGFWTGALEVSMLSFYLYFWRLIFSYWLKGNLSAGTFTIYAVICALALIFITIWVPETKGKTLEEIQWAFRWTLFLGSICFLLSEINFRNSIFPAFLKFLSDADSPIWIVRLKLGKLCFGPCNLPSMLQFIWCMGLFIWKSAIYYFFLVNTRII